MASQKHNGEPRRNQWLPYLSRAPSLERTEVQRLGEETTPL
jgi:hypothetical protein